MDISTVINTLLLCIVNSSFIMVGVFLNSVVIITLWRSSQLWKKLCYFVILVLSCFDLAVVAILHPILIISTISWSMRSSIGVFESFIGPLINTTLGGFSLFALLMLNFERFLALRYPFFHQVSVSKTRIKICFVFWMIIQVGVILLISVFGFLMLHVLITVFFFLFLCLFLFSNYQMFVIARSKREDRRIAPADGPTSGNQERKKRMINFKNISTCFLAVGCYFICFLPHIIFSSLRLSKKPWNDREVKLVSMWCKTLLFMNSTFNCLIFFWRNSILRREGMKTFKYCWV